MLSITAKRKSRDLIPSARVRTLSLDEASLEITEKLEGITLATQKATGIREGSRQTELTASTGGFL
jgi:nucleotidyltransferase/DNA polymerase involved in DNA repair